MTTLSGDIAQRLRRRMGVAKSRCHVEAVPGDAVPVLSGHAGYTHWKSASKPRWQRSTLHIIVGDAWLAVEMDYPDVLAARLGLVVDCHLLIMADLMEERGLPGYQLLRGIRAYVVTGRRGDTSIRHTHATEREAWDRRDQLLDAGWLDVRIVGLPTRGSDGRSSVILTPGAPS